MMVVSTATRQMHLTIQTRTLRKVNTQTREITTIQTTVPDTISTTNTTLTITPGTPTENDDPLNTAKQTNQSKL